MRKKRKRGALLRRTAQLAEASAAVVANDSPDGATNGASNGASSTAANVNDNDQAKTVIHPYWDRPMTPRQLAKFLQVSPSTIARQMRSNGLPSLRVQGQVRFLPSEVLAFYRRKEPVKGS